MGSFPLNICTQIKLIKYWHRLENLEQDSFLKDAFDTCKINNHVWYVNILNCLKQNGLSYVINKVKEPHSLSIEQICVRLKDKLESQYIQLWDSKSAEEVKLNYMNSDKLDNYEMSPYLSDVTNIDTGNRAIYTYKFHPFTIVY